MSARRLNLAELTVESFEPVFPDIREEFPEPGPTDQSCTILCTLWELPCC